MIRSVLLSVFIITTTVCFAEEDIFIITQMNSIRFIPIFQCWTVNDSNTFSESSFPVTAYFHFGQNLGLSFHASQASAGGDQTHELRGLTDTQVALSYYLEWANTVINFGVNVPNGRKEFTYDEFMTSYILSLNYFDFKVPSFGQGLNLSPGFSWASPLNENLVAGLGVSYQYKGKYKPFDYMIHEYDPGDEIILTSGMDYRLGATSMISVDGIYSIYATDKVGDKEVFASGNRLMVNLQFKKYFGYNNLWLFTRFRTKEKNVIAQAGSMDLAREEMTPNQFEYLGQFQFHPTQMMALGIVVNGRYYEETNDYPGVNIVGFGMTPEIRISQNIIIPLRFLYFLGSYKNRSRISGLEATLGFSFGF